MDDNILKGDQMTPKELLERQRALVGDNAAAMARLLKTEASTYWKWLNGQRRIPGIAEVAIEGLEYRNANLKKGNGI